MKELIKMLEREKKLHTEELRNHCHDEIEEIGFINGMNYCINLLKKSDALSDSTLKEKILETSNVEKIRWDKNNLFIHFNNGNVYQYFDVPEKVSVEMGNAESPGSFLYQEIKGKYRYSRID